MTPDTLDAQCPGYGPDAGVCNNLPEPGEVYCATCRDHAQADDDANNYDPAEPWMDVTP